MVGWIIFGVVLAFVLGVVLGLVLYAWANSKEDPCVGDLYIMEDGECHADFKIHPLDIRKKYHFIHFHVRIINSPYSGEVNPGKDGKRR